MSETDDRDRSSESDSAASEAATSNDAPPEPASNDAPAEPASNDVAQGEAKPDAASDKAQVSEPARAETQLDDTPAAPPGTMPASASPEPTEPEEARDSTVEVDPELIESVRGAQRPVEHRLPPPPPSVRIKGGTSRLEVSGTPKLARDLMTKKIFTIGPNDIIEHLEEQMQAFRFRHLPVVEGKKLVGLITHSDLLHASSSFLSDKVKERDELIHKLPASRVMQSELITVRPTDTLVEVTELMWEARVGCVLVTEADGTLVGIITEADFIRMAHHLLVRDQAAPS